LADKGKAGGNPAKGGKPPQQQQQPPKDKAAVAPKGVIVEKASGSAKEPPSLKVKYRTEVVPALMKEFNYTNAMQVPGLTKVVVNLGLGEAIANAKALDTAVGDLTAIVGQKPVINKAKKSIAAFKLREGMAVGASVTLRGDRMFEFLDRLMNVALPRVRDFTGVPTKSFDGHGNYTLGLKEQIIFPEIDYDKVDRVRGMEITVVTTAKNDEQGQKLLRLLGMPFRKN
jgi:large subunit ribosomal protein L5